MIKLTRKQLESFKSELYGKKSYKEKINHCIREFNNRLKSMHHNLIITDQNLEWFIEEFLPTEEKRIKREFFYDSLSGKVNSHFTPTDIDGTFTEIKNPRIGIKYHLSWAFKGAVFILKKLDSDGIHGYVDNPRYKRNNLLKIKIKDLRGLKKNL